MKYKWKKLSKTKPKKTGLYYVEYFITYLNGGKEKCVNIARYVAKKKRFKTSFYDEPFPRQILRWAKK